MLAATRAGDGWLWAAIGLTLLAFSESPERFAAVAAGTSAAILSVMLFLVLKRLINRRRPCEIEPHCWATMQPPDAYSFPSGHTMVAFAVAVPVAAFYADLLPTMVFCASCVGFSRIALGMHFLTDVIAGSALGGALGFWSYLMFS
jgi:undecaprenyl-diphosphatase